MSPVSEFFGWQSLGFGRLDCGVSGEPLDDGIGYRFSGLFFYMKFVSSASSPTTHLFSSTAHTLPLYELWSNGHIMHNLLSTVAL